jgi:hypothetical protein
MEEPAKPVLPEKGGIHNLTTYPIIRRELIFVIPAKAGIQGFSEVNSYLDPGFRRGDDYS